MKLLHPLLKAIPVPSPFIFLSPGKVNTFTFTKINTAQNSAPSKRDFNSFEEYRQYKVTQSNLKHAKDFIENFSSHTPIKTSQLQPFFIDATNTNIQKKSPLDVFEMKPPVFDGNKDHAQQFINEIYTFLLITM